MFVGRSAYGQVPDKVLQTCIVAVDPTQGLLLLNWGPFLVSYSTYYGVCRNYMDGSDWKNVLETHVASIPFTIPIQPPIRRHTYFNNFTERGAIRTGCPWVGHTAADLQLALCRLGGPC
jgi:hypothetical protein